MRIKGFGIIGSILAVVLSWIVNHSVGWAIVHFFCSWLYVIYWLIVKTRFYDWLRSLVR
jgi:hypothetical protein